MGMIIKMETKHEEKDCGQCDYKYETLEELMNHVRNTPNHEPKCSECDTTYVSMTIFRQHLRKIHFNKGEVVCPDCGKISTNQQQQYHHWYVVHKEKVYRDDLFCNLCGKGNWQNLNKLKQHTRKCLRRNPIHVEKERKISMKENPKCAEQVFTWTKKRYLEWQKQKLTNNNDNDVTKKSKKEKLPTNDKKPKSNNSKKRSVKETTLEENETTKAKKRKSMDGSTNLLLKKDDSEMDNMKEEIWKEEPEDIGYDLLWNDDDDDSEAANIKEDLEIKTEANEDVYNQMNAIDNIQNKKAEALSNIDQIVEATFLDNNQGIEESRKLETIKSENEYEYENENYTKEIDVDDKKYKCPAPGCNSSFNDGSNYRRHYSRKHKIIEELESENENKSKPESEMTQIKTPKPIIKGKSLDKYHPKNTTPVPDDLTCRECNTTLKDVKSYRRHVRVQHSETGGKVICPVCSKLVHKSHINYAHKEEPCICDVCSAQFLNTTKLKRHKSRVHGEKEESPCPYCSQIYETKDKLAQHISYVHKEEPCICDVCSVQFLNKTKLKKHKRKVHGDIENVPCPHCDQVIETKYKLSQHIAQAHKAEPSVCDVCSAVFKNRHSLMGHKRKVHGTIENLPCPHCDKIIETKYKLSQHIYRDHNLQEYPCDICGETYKNTRLLQAHKRMMHPDS